MRPVDRQPGQCGSGSGDGLLDLGDRREGDVVLSLARGGVEHRAGALGVGDVAACDEVLDEGHIGGLLVVLMTDSDGMTEDV